MPSGSKKRKAAKKKKGVELSSSNNSNSTVPSASTATSHGDDDLKHQDDKESDVGEVSSPASQEHHSHEHHFTEDEDEGMEPREESSNLPSVGGINNEGVGEQKLIVEERSVVLVQRELEHENELGSNDVKNEYDELVMKSYDGGLSGSSSSSNSSDDESHGVEDSNIDNAPFVESAKSAKFLSERQAVVIHSDTVVQPVDSFIEPGPVVDSENVTFFDNEVQVNVDAAVSSMDTFMVQSELKINGEKNLNSADQKVEKSATSMDALSEREEDEPTVQLIEPSVETSDTKECETQKNDGILIAPYNAPRVDTNNGVEHEIASDVHEPLIAPAPYPVQKTSWKSCCGLFEVLTGSSI